MCGIFGLFVKPDAGLDKAFIKKALMTLARLSESRGKDSSGIVWRNEFARELTVIKGSVPLNYLLEAPTVLRKLDGMLDAFGSNAGSAAKNALAIMGHSRLVTNGSQLRIENNQPVVKDGIVGIHNGIIVNDAKLWRQNPDIARSCDIDTEVMLALIRKQLSSGADLASAVSETTSQIFGTVSAAFLFEDRDSFALATNNGSLYFLHQPGKMFAFASEKYFVSKLARTMGLASERGLRCRHVVPGRGWLLCLERFALEEFFFGENSHKPAPLGVRNGSYRIVVEAVSDGKPEKELVLDPSMIAAHPRARSESKLLQNNANRIQALRRCTKCLLPETFPFIYFDRGGVCNYCANYVLKNQPKPVEELFELVAPYRRVDGSPDCIIPFSGGRDSTFALHVAKTALKLNPIAFTYDWGMVTDLARRNIARVCGKLGVENILVSADIAWKRDNIRMNILAWLRKPRLGMIPLFMAGDKFFFYYTDQVKRQTGIRLNIWGINPLENTDFKVGFLGVPPDHRKKRIYSLSAKRQARLLMSIGKVVAENPSYLNRSVWDTLGSFVSRSVIPHRDYYHLYDYFRWDEEEIDKLVLEEYRWETAIDTRTTWRIGDGTAAFYNYIYFTVAGFSEYDTFRSNQIREGMLTREKGLQLVMEENRPRYPSIKWYTDILGLDFESTVKAINAIPKRYA